MLFALLLTFALTIGVFAADFPTGPELSITPGKLCDRPTALRYPEKIPYCTRDVSYDTKEILMKEYDQKFDYHIMTITRTDFKIDHLIPLCAGGSNDITNLWPQHKSVYEITDPLEPVICAKMAQGRLNQKDAVSLVIEAKTHLDRVPVILQNVNKM
ncbi:MAG: hypothetical protein H7336_08150 [Bacteriovorax sp.]|nr:hypothetical protein [Bacteriovorax sp.]